ncbi:MAG: RrF2 family transcriptional regulator [Candidatus Muiribacteriota bacterium]
MKFSTRSRYASRALYELAKNNNSKPVSLTKISEKTGISLRYLEQIMRKLKKKGYVKTVQGINGGYLIAVKLSEISLKDIVDTLEGKGYPVECVVKDDFCNKIESCAMRKIWVEVHNSVGDVLSKYTLEELVK